LVLNAAGFAAAAYDVSRDGRFLIANRVGDGDGDDERKLVMISNWRAKVGR
jgi:hypothetical protein